MGFLINPYWFVAATPGEEYVNYYSNDFDGVDDVVAASTLADLGITGDTFSVSFWMKHPGSLGNYSTFLGATRNASWNNGFAVMYVNTGSPPANQLRFWINGWNAAGYAYADLTTTEANSWIHVACVYDGTNTKVYKNGVVGTNGSMTGDIVYEYLGTPFTFMIGRAETATSYDFAGNIDEVAVWNTALSASDITTIYNSGTPADLSSLSPTAWWRMGDGPKYPIIKNQAHFSQISLDFDGVDDYVDCGNASSLQITGALSVSFWVKYTSSGVFCAIAKDQFPGTRGWSLWLKSGTIPIFYVWNGASYYTSGSTSSMINDGNWHHVVGVYNPSTAVQLYVDGSLVSQNTTSIPASINNTTENLGIGRWALNNATTYSEACNMDDVSIYSSALSASDITDIYNSGYPKDESERSGLVAYYKFDGDIYPVAQNALQFSNASLDFDGVDDYVDLSSFDIDTTSAWSISLWLNLDSFTPAYPNVFALKTDQSTSFIGFISATGSYDGFNFGSSSNFVNLRSNTTTGNNFLTTWKHVVITYNGSGITTTGNYTIYIDGSDDGTQASGAFSLCPNVSKIGESNSASQRFNGNIDDAIIFDAELSASDVTDIYNSGKPKDESSTSNVVGYWKMGDNTISPNVPSALGYGTHSVAFDGVDDYVDLGRVEPSTTALSISAWVYKTDATDAGIVTKYASTDYGLGIFGTNLYLSIKTASWSGATAAFTGSYLNQCVHVCGTWYGSTITLYINGSSVATASKTGSITYSANNTRIGDLEGAAGWNFDGNIKQVGIFDSALSASDVTSIYNSGLPKNISSESGLVSYYRMGDGEDKYPNLLDYKGTAHGTMTNMASDDITTANVGSGLMTNMASDDIEADAPEGSSGQMTNMASDDFVAAKGAGTMTNMDAEDIVADVPS